MQVTPREQLRGQKCMDWRVPDIHPVSIAAPATHVVRSCCVHSSNAGGMA